MVAIDWPAFLPCDAFTNFCLEILEDLEEQQVEPSVIRRVAAGRNLGRHLTWQKTYDEDRVAAAVMQLYKNGNPRK